MPDAAPGGGFARKLSEIEGSEHVANVRVASSNPVSCSSLPSPTLTLEVDPGHGARRGVRRSIAGQFPLQVRDVGYWIAPSSVRARSCSSTRRSALGWPQVAQNLYACGKPMPTRLKVSQPRGSP